MTILLKLILFKVATKVAAFVVAKTYGFPRLYRRMMEVNKRIVTPMWIRGQITYGVQWMMRLPKVAYRGALARIRNSFGTSTETSGSSASSPVAPPSSVVPKPSQSSAHRSGSNGTSPSSSTSRYECRQVLSPWTVPLPFGGTISIVDGDPFRASPACWTLDRGAKTQGRLF